MTEREAVMQLVKKIGGPFAIATALKAILGDSAPTRGSVAQWLTLGRVPWKWRHSVRSIVEERKIELTDDEQEALSLEPRRQAS